MAAPPAKPKRRAAIRRWQPPEYGDYYQRRTDGQVFQVNGIFRRDAQVKLAPCQPDERSVYVFADELERDWTPRP